MCESPFVIPPGPHKFNFTLLYDFVTAIKAACPEDARLFVPDRVSLHNEACQSIVGEGWTAYEIDLIWSTVITWEALLFQLISQFQRPPLGFWAQAFTTVHLFGNPIDTIASFLYTLALCQFRARKFKKGGHNGRWKLATLVMISYDECGNDEAAMLQCLESFYQDNRPELEDRDIYKDAVQALAADRATQLFPIGFAQPLAIAVLIVSLVQGFSSQPGQDQWNIVVIHAGSFAILYVWIISAVFLSCIIGVSQSELAIPRILDRLQHDVKQRFEKDAAREMQQTSKTRPFSEMYTIRDTRICRGGIYSWRPDKWQPMRSISTLNAHPSFNYTLALHLASMFLVTCTFLVSVSISALVPPEGFNCRHIAQIITLALWLLNSLADPFLANYYFPATATATSGSASGLYKALFRATLIKDALVATAGMIILIFGQSGIYNRCTCWTQWGNAALVLPQLEGIAATVDSRLRVWWVLIALGLGLQAVFCGGCARMFWDAVKVYLMKDEGGVVEVMVEASPSGTRD